MAANAPTFANLGALVAPDGNHDDVAVIDLSGPAPQSYSFAQLDAAAAGFARMLAARDLARGDRVAILSANRFAYLAAFYGILRAGLVAVPVNFKFPRATIHFVIGDSGARLVLADAPRRADAPPDVPMLCFDSAPDMADAAPAAGFATILPSPDEPAMFLYTSGSTGQPKGVILSHESHLWVVRTRLADAARNGADPARFRYLIAAPLFHMNALALSLLACAGHSSMVLLPQFDARAYISAIGAQRTTHLTAVPPMIAMLLREAALLESTDLSSVVSIRMGSAPVSASLLDSIKRTFPAAAITNAYGTTEAGPVVFGPHPHGLPAPPLALGCARVDVAVRLVDAQGNPANPGTLQMRCPALMEGYHNRPDIASPITADGFYHTNDNFFRDENGFYSFIGRTDDMFVSGGNNIFPGDVEKMLETHPSVMQACVVPVDDDIKGTKPVAFIVARPGTTPTEAEIKAFALANAPAYQHPRAVWFVGKLPLASTNKLDRAALRQQARAALA